MKHDQTREINDSRRFSRQLLIMILISLLLHVILSLSYLLNRDIFLLHAFQPPMQNQEEIEKQLEFELIDVPSDAEPLKEKVDTPYISDRSARARDMHQAAAVPVGEAMSLGEEEQLSEFGPGGAEQTIANPPQQTERTDRNQENVDKPTDSRQKPDPSEVLRYEQERSGTQLNKDFWQNTFSSKYFPSELEPQKKSDPQRPLRKNTETKAPDSGGFALNTYDWEWAPYLQEVKIKIERNLFLPEAFRLLGLINGETVVRFRIHRDGHVDEIEVLRSQGHDSLMHSSVNSIKGAQPFKPLPDSFPSSYPYLEITAYYRYTNR